MNLGGNETYIRNANNYVDQRDASELGATVFSPGTVVFPKVGAAIATNKKRALTIPTIIDNNMVGVTVSDEERCDARFLHNWFELTDLSQLANVSAVPSITGSRLKGVLVSLPPLAEQQAIAAVLDSIDKAIEQTEAVVASAERLRDALLHELLTRSVPGWHTEWKDAPGIGTIPACWDVVRLEHVAEVNPRRPTLKVPDEVLVTFLPMAAIADEFLGILRRDQRPYCEVSTGYTYFEEEDILFSKITPCLQNGKHALATGLRGGFGFGTTEFHVVRAGESVIAQYLFHVMTQAHLIEQCRKSFTGTAGQQRVQPETLRSLRFTVPPIAEQRTIAAMLDRVKNAIDGLYDERDGLQSLKASMSDALLTARLRVKPMLKVRA